jgi:hypothetical protein
VELVHGRCSPHAGAQIWTVARGSLARLASFAINDTFLEFESEMLPEARLQLHL